MDLRSAAAASGPVRPLKSPLWRAVLVSGLGVAVAALAVASRGVRPDAPELGALLVWLPAVLRVAAGAWLIYLTMREGSPSEGAPGGAFAATLAVVPLLLVGSAEALARMGGGGGGIAPLGCYPRTIGFAIPAAALCAWLLARAYPLRVLFAAAGGASGVGLLAEAVLHLTCPSTSRAHVLLIHGGAIATLLLVSVLAAAAGARRREQRLR